jgi:hypothetical protein
MLIVLAAATQMLYEAQVATFGCNSTGEVAKLQSMRPNQDAFQKQLMGHVFLGECIVIGQGAILEAAPEADDASVLRIERRRSPPGFMAPSGDFKAKPADAKP